MKNDEPIDEKKQAGEDPKSVLQQIIQEGARKLLLAEIEVDNRDRSIENPATQDQRQT